MTVATSPDICDRTEAHQLLHQRIARYQRQRLTPVLTDDKEEGTDPAGLGEDGQSAFLAAERRAVSERARRAPTDPDGFIAWFEDLRATGPGQGDELFPWLAEEASREDMLWFLRQELAGEAGFDDLVALTQVKMPARPKMEMARNLWDEFGRGNPAGVHGTLLDGMAAELDIESAGDDAVWEALALSNLLVGLALDRRYAYQAAGALGVIEMTAPGRVALVAAGLRRLGVPPAARRYHELHASLDVAHSRAWNAEVLRPLVELDQRIAPLLAEGALMRLEAGRRCFARYRSVLMRD